jgi:hypothetical protein
LAEDFVNWLEGDEHRRGIIARPRDFEDRSHDTSPMITDWLAEPTEVVGIDGRP